MRKRENSGNQYFLLFPQCFLPYKIEKLPSWLQLLCIVTDTMFCSLIKNETFHSPIAQLVQDLRIGGCWFNPGLDQYFFRGLMKVMGTGHIPLSPLSIVSTMVMWVRSQWLGRNIVQECWLKELQVGMDRCTGHHDLTGILLKTAYNQSFYSHTRLKVNI